MRPIIGTALCAMALLFAAGCVTTPETACNVGQESGALARIQGTLKGQTTRDGYNTALRAAYPELTQIHARTSQGVPGVDAGEQIACYVIAAEAAMIQSYLPASERAAVAPAGSAPPAQTAKVSADAAIGLCGLADEPQRCAVARMISGTALSNDTFDQINGLAENEASTLTVEGWTEADTLIDSFGVTTRGWSELVAQTSTIPNGLSREEAQAYLTPLACGVFADAGAIRGRSTPAENDAAAEAFATSYLDAMDDIAEELGLTPPAAAAQVCEDTPESPICREAGAGAVLNLCTAFWGFSGT